MGLALNAPSLGADPFRPHLACITFRTAFSHLAVTYTYGTHSVLVGSVAAPICFAC
jgi:hypothetical protein